MDQFVAMHAFRRVVETGSFTAAAEEQRKSHTVYSRLVRQLEASLGVQLLNRSTRSLSLTEAGQAYYDSCVRILDEVEQAALAVSALQAVPRGNLRVSMSMVYGGIEAADWIADFAERYPAIQLTVHCDDRFVDPIEEGYDVCLRIAQSLPDSELIAKRLVGSAMVLVAAPAYLKRLGRRIERPGDLADLDFLGYSNVSNAAQLTFMHARLGGETVQLRTKLESNSPLLLLGAARAGAGLATFDHFIARRDLEAGLLVPVLPEWTLPQRSMCALYPRSRHVSPKVRALISFLEARYAALNPPVA